MPGKFITSLAEDGARGRLLIGTMNLGLVVLDLSTGRMSALSDTIPSFDAENITSLLAARDGQVWIGTYGQGLYAWAPDTGALTHFTKDSGQIGDDWILSSCETDRALYFGSFGGGVSAFLKKEGVWRRIGIADGLASLDIPAIAWRAPYVFFGTLGAGVGVYDEAADGAYP
jgi:ligand-binding sensor domain-containing protein